MQFSFWRDWTSKLPFLTKANAAPAVAATPAPVVPSKSVSSASPEFGDVDLRTIWEAMVRRRMWIIVPTAVAFVLSLFVVNMITPRYKSEARILIDGRKTSSCVRMGSEPRSGGSLDAEAVTSQVQLLLSRDLAREVIKANKLAELPEFDPVLSGVSPLRTLLALFGIGRDPFKMTPRNGCWKPITSG